MALREDLLPVVNDAARQLMVDLGLRTHTLTVRLKTWASGRIGLPHDDDANVDLLITPAPKIREVSSREIASSGGAFQQGDLLVTKITPDYAGGGYTPAELAPAADGSQEIIYLVAGPNAGEYTLAGSDFSRNFEYRLTLRRSRRTP